MGDFETTVVAGRRTNESEFGGFVLPAIPVQRERTLDEAVRHFNQQMEAVERAIDEKEMSGEKVFESLRSIMNEMLNTAERFEREAGNPERVREMRASFHRSTHHIFEKGYLMNRARTWPSGHQGDHKMLETVYRNVPLSKGIGYYLDLYSLRSTLAVAVRNRIKILSGLLAKELNGRKRPRALNIGCGSSRELFDIVPEIIRSRAQITCIDSDEDALFFSQNRLSYTDAISQINFRKYNALRLFDAETALKDFGKQDIIYSAGLFDYLESDFLVKVISSLYGLLNKGGKLIAPFKDAERYRPSLYHWVTDWDGFKQRTKEDFLAILRAAGIPSDAIRVRSDETGAIIFYTVTKS